MREWRRYSIRQLVGAPISGKRPTGGVNAESEGIPSLGGENIRADGGMDYGNINRVPVEFFRSMPKGRLQANDVLINKDGAQTGKVGLYDGRFDEAAVNEHVFILRSSSGAIDQRLLYYFLLLPDTQLRIARRITGSAQPGLNSQFADAVHLTVPSERGEQCRIAEILSTVDEAIEHTEVLIAKTQQIKAGLMRDLFTRGVTADGQLRAPREEAPQLYHKWAPEYVPSSWDREMLGSVTPENSPICYGIVQPGEHKPDGIPVTAIHNLNVDFATAHRSSEEIESAYVRSRIRGGDVLLSIKGSIGRVDVTPDGFVGNISRDVARIRPRNGIHPGFLRYALESASLQTALSRISVGTTRAELSIGRLKQVPVYLPPESEQVAIADRLVAVDEILNAERSVLGKLGKQRRGLMADLLSGRVLVAISADPNLTGVAANV